jgi:HEAT repeat protein
VTALPKGNEDSMRTIMTILALTCAAAIAAPAAPADREKRLPVPPTAPLAATTEAELAAVLKSDAQLKDKVDACREIGRVGTAASVPVLAALLPNPELSHAARVALEMIPDPAAGEALRAALGTTTGAVRTGVAGSLGQRRDAKAVPALAALLKTPDAALAETSAKALGRIGGADAVTALEGALADAPVPLRAAIGEGLLRCADAAGSDRAARAIHDKLRAADVPATVRMAAFRGAILTRGDDGVPLILDALRGSDGLAITAALRAAHELPGRGATKQLAAALGSLPPAIRPSVVALLGARGDAAAAPALIEVAKTPGDIALRTGAIGALVMTSAEAAVPVLADLALDGDTNLAAAARGALGSIPGRKADAAVLELLDNKDAAIRAVAVELIAQRAPAGSGARLLKAASDPDEKVRVASLRALRACATVDDIPALLGLLAKSGAGAESQAAEGALAAICAREVRKTPARVTIVKAVYGDLPDGRSANVTAIVAEKIKGGATSIDAGNALFGDPAGGSVKSLAVTYTANGVQGTRTVREGETIVFPAVANDPPCSAALLKAVPSAPAPSKLALLRVLGSTGGPKAFEAIRAAAAGGEAEVRGAAMRILCEWPTALALPVLRETARTDADPAIKLLALRGAIRLVPQTDQPAAAKLAALAELGALVTRDDERKIVLAALGEIPSPEALALVMKDIDAPALKDEAAAAAVNIGEMIARTHAEAVAAAMKKANAATENKQIKRRIGALIRDTKPQ